MSEENNSLPDLIDQLPVRLQTRFESIGNYVQGLIEELKIELKIERKYSKEEVRIIQFAAFVYSIDDFFRLGTRAARNASLTFTQFKLPGFRVGTTRFTPSNENTMLGFTLAEKLKKSIANTELARYVNQARSMKELVRLLMEAFRDDI